MKEKRSITEKNENELLDNYYGESDIAPDVEPLAANNESLVRRNEGKEDGKPQD